MNLELFTEIVTIVFGIALIVLAIFLVLLILKRLGILDLIIEEVFKVKKDTWICVAILTVGLILAFWVIPNVEVSSTTRILIISLIVLGVGLLVFVGISVAVIGSGLKTEKKEGEFTEILGGIIRNIPSNHCWVVRNAWNSNPETMSGYREKHEGWRFYIPKLLHIDLGLVDLTPLQKDEGKIAVHTEDHQTCEIDTRHTSSIVGPAKYLARTEAELGEEEKGRVNFLRQKIQVLLNNLSSSVTVDNITGLKGPQFEKMLKKEDITGLTAEAAVNDLVRDLEVKDDQGKVKEGETETLRIGAILEYCQFLKQTIDFHEDLDCDPDVIPETSTVTKIKDAREPLKKLSKIVSEEFYFFSNKETGRLVLLLRKNYLEELNIELAEYGINVERVEIQQIIPPADIRDASEAKVVARKTREAATDEAEKMALVIERTGANPTWVVVGDILAKAFGGGLLTGRFGKKENKEGSKNP